jgi:RNA polymerase sigma factor (sigma-70 family)
VAKRIQKRNALVEANMDLVKIVANRILSRVPPSIELDDLVQAGYLGLIDAAEKFDPGKKVPFRGYAYLRIRGEIIDSFRRSEYREATHESLDRPDSLIYAQADHEIERNVERWQTKERLLRMLDRSGVDKRERVVLANMYVAEDNQTHIGKTLGICSSRVSQIHRGALARLQRVESGDYGGVSRRGLFIGKPSSRAQ